MLCANSEGDKSVLSVCPCSGYSNGVTVQDGRELLYRHLVALPLPQDKEKGLSIQPFNQPIERKTAHSSLLLTSSFIVLSLR